MTKKKQNIFFFVKFETLKRRRKLSHFFPTWLGTRCWKKTESSHVSNQVSFDFFFKSSIDWLQSKIWYISSEITHWSFMVVIKQTSKKNYYYYVNKNAGKFAKKNETKSTTNIICFFISMMITIGQIKKKKKIRINLILVCMCVA